MHLAMDSIPNSTDILLAVIEATPDAIFVKDRDGRYVIVNQAAARFVGGKPADMIGKNDLELYPEETARRFMADDRAVIESGADMSFEGVATSAVGTQAYLVTKGGAYRDASGAILGVYGISHDITELRVAQESLEQTRAELFRSQKMEAVGQLTGGIAHDFNNILMVILGNLELLKQRVPKGDGHAVELIDETVRAIRHGQDLTGDLLAFSRRRQLSPEPVDINTLRGEHCPAAGSHAGRERPHRDRDQPDAGVAMVDPAALEAAMLNIALNARDAMPEGGTLTIHTSKADITQAPRTDDDLAVGQYAMVTIEDTGSGMPPEVVARAFEPFFTTKTGGGGSGLGLSMVYGFAKQTGGTVHIASEPGRGTTVSIYLPLTSNEPRSVAASAARVAAPLVSRTILVVEDEPAVRTTVRRQLEVLGYKVFVADTAAAALPFLQGAEPIDVMLTDVVLGAGMNGIDLADVARASRPGLPVILMSGFTAVPEAQARVRALGAPHAVEAVDAVAAGGRAACGVSGRAARLTSGAATTQELRGR